MGVKYSGLCADMVTRTTRGTRRGHPSFSLRECEDIDDDQVVGRQSMPGLHRKLNSLPGVDKKV